MQSLMTATSSATIGDNSENNRLLAENDLLRRELRALRLQLGELERLADSDTLTPLLNRRAFLREVERGIARVTRHATPVAVMIADLDGLKAINDGLGHQAGDAMLMRVGYALKASVRATDIVARIGGDEFGLVLESLDAEGAAAKAVSLRTAIAAEPLDGIAASISIGYTMVAVGDDIDTVIARADTAMYAQKRAQRPDRVERI